MVELGRLMDRAKECPFASAETMWLPHKLEVGTQHGDDLKWYHVSCLSCGAVGPLANTPEGAVRKWNRRA